MKRALCSLRPPWSRARDPFANRKEEGEAVRAAGFGGNGVNPASATFSPLDQIGIGGHKPPLLLDRLCTSLEFGVQTRFAGTT